MPYRRLPNTDQARLTALQMAVQRASEADFTEQVLQYKTLSEAQRFLMQFENTVMQYHENFRTKVSANKQYRKVVQNARMYISHFIQVLNLAVIRGEIKDPRINPMTSVVAVEVAPDLKTAKAYISVLGDEQSQKDTLAGLRSAEGFIRMKLAKSINLRNTPEIKFVLDQSIEYGIRMSKMIDDVTKDQKESMDE